MVKSFWFINPASACPVCPVSEVNYLFLENHTAIIARAFLAAEMKAEPGEPYNICSGKVISSKEIAEALSNYNNAVKINFVKVRNAKEIIGDNRKFFRTTGWRPIVEIDASLKGIIN